MGRKPKNPKGAESTCDFEVLLPVENVTAQYLALFVKQENKCGAPAPYRLHVERVNEQNYHDRKVSVDKYLCPAHFTFVCQHLAQQTLAIARRKRK